MSRVEADGELDDIIDAIKRNAMERNVCVTRVTAIKLWKQRKHTYNLRVNVRSEDSDKALEHVFWPEVILVKPWQTERERNYRHSDE